MAENTFSKWALVAEKVTFWEFPFALTCNSARSRKAVASFITRQIWSRLLGKVALRMGNFILLQCLDEGIIDLYSF